MFEKLAMAHRMLWQTVIKVAVEDYKAGKLSRSYFASKGFSLHCELAGVQEADVLDLL